MIRFSDWIKTRESSAFTRWRHDYALGLKPGLPGNVNSRSTAAPWEQEKVKKKKKGKKRKQKKVEETIVDNTIGFNDEMVYAIDEKKKLQRPDTKLDDFLNRVGVVQQEKDALWKQTKDEIDKLDKEAKQKKEKKDKKDKKDVPSDKCRKKEAR